MAQTVSPWSLTVEARFRYEVSPSNIFVGHIDTWTGFTLSVSIQHCSVPIFIHMLLLLEGQTGAAWEPSRIKALSEIGGHWLEKSFHFFCVVTGKISYVEVVQIGSGEKGRKVVIS